MKKLQTLLFIMLIALSGVVLPDDGERGSYTATLDRVVDGDTIDVTIYLGFDVYTKQRLRIHGIDTPESRTSDDVEKFYGKLAKERVKELVPEKFLLYIYGEGKFGRPLADIELADDVMLTDRLIQECHAVQYFGGNKDELEQGHLNNRECLSDRGIEP